MNLLATLSRLIELYLAGESTLSQLQLELVDAEQLALDAARGGNTGPERLLGLVVLLISEYSLGHRSEESIRDELLTALGEQALHGFGQAQAASLALGTRSYVQTLHLPAINAQPAQLVGTPSSLRAA